MVGSANFTTMGITGNIEMSVLFEEEAQVDELGQWFNDLWKHSDVVSVDELDKYILSLPHVQIPSEDIQKPSITSSVLPIHSRFVERKCAPPGFIHDEHAHEQLVERIKRVPSSKWMDHYFDLMKELVERVEFKMMTRGL
ncbi:MAG: hypothetical protein IPJ07_18115 [Acidobacteria bacterium]|nr:hypothetical protein [Acidobacteriota bacterium]